MATDTQQTTTRFLTFVRRSQEVLARGEGPQAPEKAFEQFITAAMPLVLPRLKSSLPLLVKRAELVHRWLTPHDILAVAGLAYAENPYIELVAWLLDPQTDPLSAMRRQEVWLRVLGLEGQIEVTNPVTPRTQFRTDDGIPDLILEYPNGVVIVEVKTFSVEHPAPSGQPQTLAYALSVRRRLALSDDTPTHVVFLTPDGHSPQNPEAIATTFTALVVALAMALPPEDVPPDLRWALSTVFTHLLNHTFLGGVDVHALLNEVIQWSSELSHPETDVMLMVRLKRIQQATKLLLPEARS